MAVTDVFEQVCNNGSAIAAPAAVEGLSELFEHYGIAESYFGFSGEKIAIALEDRLSILKCMDVTVADGMGQPVHDLVRAAKQSRADSHWHSLLPPVKVFWQGAQVDRQQLSIVLRLSAVNLSEPLNWELQLETGDLYDGTVVPSNLTRLMTRQIGAVEYVQLDLALSQFCINELPPGYHKFSITAANRIDGSLDKSSTPAAVSTLIVAPSRCFEPPWVVSSRRRWGVSVQLYSLRSAENWGVGDFGDLSRLIGLLASHGGDYIILNPLHAGNAATPEQCSPYSPADRRRLNPMYICIESVPEFADCLSADPDLIASIRLEIASLAQCKWIDYSAVSRLKYRVFRFMYSHFLQRSDSQSARHSRYLAFVEREGKALQQFITWQAAQAVKDAGEHAEDPNFYAYLQWLCNDQLEDCQQLAVNHGMQTGLIRDLAVGSDRRGSEVALNPHTFCLAASIGAPPDPLAPQGQNWGLPPIDPFSLRQREYRHFVELLRSNMSHCGALRIDHVMALMRLWWCQEGGNSARGAYVYYPVKDLFAILCLESQRHRCMVIGEDLGVVPPEVRDYLRRSGIFSNILFYFEKYDELQFRRPEHFAGKALCMVANHDVPTLAAWWNGYDLELRRELELIGDDAELQEQLQSRANERVHVGHWLEAQWLLPAERFGQDLHNPMDISLAAAIIRCCARSQSQMLAVQLEDLVLEKQPVNIPGTSIEYPNWCRKLPATVWDVLASGTQHSMLQAISAERI
jgi:4-alpha-glucanotransferase